VNPNDWRVQHNMGLVGAFVGGPISGLGGGSPEYLQFIHNPNARPSTISPFHSNVISQYAVEYNMELARYADVNFRECPSRLWALFLFAGTDDANAYAIARPDHVNGRNLKRCVTKGAYRYSIHDAAWIDFLRIGHSVDQDTYSHCAHGYWSGARANEGEFMSMGKRWIPQSVSEVLFYGTVEFPNKDPSISDHPPQRARSCRLSGLLSRLMLLIHRKTSAT
jgi:hypothetical protein